MTTETGKQTFQTAAEVKRFLKSISVGPVKSVKRHISPFDGSLSWSATVPLVPPGVGRTTSFNLRYGGETESSTDNNVTADKIVALKNKVAAYTRQVSIYADRLDA